MEQRAFATLELRSVNDELRQFEGIANTNALDDHDTIIEPAGARFKLPMPLLWFHDQKTPVGEITHAELRGGKWWVTGTIATVTEPGLVKDAVDRAWQQIKYGLVKGLSIGFSDFKQKGKRITDWLWRELSLVSLPSNTEASIIAVRSAYNAAASGGTLVDFVPTGDRREWNWPPRPGVSGTQPTPRHGKMTIQEQITQHENTRAAKVARKEALIETSSKEGRTLDDKESEEFDTLDAEVRSVDEHLVRLNTLKKDNEKKAVAVTATNTNTATQSRAGVPVVSVRANDAPGLGFARYVMAKAASAKLGMDIGVYAREVFGEEQGGEIETWQRTSIMQTRAAVAPGTSVQATFAAPLIITNYIQDLLALLRPATLLGRIPGLRHVPFNISMPAQTAGGTYKWVGQGKAKPVTNAQYASVTLSFAKASGIIVLTDELVRQSTPSAQEAVRDEIVKGAQQFLDAQFVDPAVAAVANVNPASITNGVAGTAASAATMAAARTDIAAKIASFATALYPISELVILMSESLAFNLGLGLNAVGAPLFPDLSITGGTILGVPVVTSQALTNQVVFLHAPSILMADENGVEIDVSREASLQLDSAPDDPPLATTIPTSLWQFNLVGMRMERYITWGKARSTAVDRITAAAYAP